MFLFQSGSASGSHPVWGYAGRITLGDIVQTSVIALGIALNHRAEMGRKISCYTLLTRAGESQRAEYHATALWPAIYDCADYRRHALKSVGIILSISLLIAPAQLPFADARRFARARWDSGESVSYYRFAGVYLSFILIARQRRPSWYYLPSCFIAAFIYATCGATGVMRKSYQGARLTLFCLLFRKHTVII